MIPAVVCKDDLPPEVILGIGRESRAQVLPDAARLAAWGCLPAVPPEGKLWDWLAVLIGVRRLLEAARGEEIRAVLLRQPPSLDGV